MAPNKTQQARQQPLVKPVQRAKPRSVFSETISTPYGDIIMEFDRETVNSTIELYASKLMQARGIPQDRYNITPRDPNLKILQQKNKGVPVSVLVPMLRHFYDGQALRAQQEGAILSAFANPANTFTLEPEEYTIPESLPGLEDDIPPVVPNLQIKLEYRLKQIMDLMLKHPSLSEKFENAFDRLNDAVMGVVDEVDQDGFQSESTD